MKRLARECATRFSQVGVNDPRPPGFSIHRIPHERPSSCGKVRANLMRAAGHEAAPQECKTRPRRRRLSNPFELSRARRADRARRGSSFCDPSDRAADADRSSPAEDGRGRRPSPGNPSLQPPPSSCAEAPHARPRFSPPARCPMSTCRAGRRSMDDWRRASDARARRVCSSAWRRAARASDARPAPQACSRQEGDCLRREREGRRDVVRSISESLALPEYRRSARLLPRRAWRPGERCDH